MEAGKLNLPESIYHLAHGRQYPLFLRKYELSEFLDSDDSGYCSICLDIIVVGDYFYACDHKEYSNHICNLKVDIACSSIRAGVDFQGHSHLLFFLERVNPSFPQICLSCDGYSSELMFRCVKDDCYYGLHLSCGPLPIVIPYYHSGHELTLTLKDSLLNGADPDDSWCDICEEQRDPTKCVYHSEDPPFTATTDCVLPQIVGALHGDLEEVKLRTVRQHVPGIVLVNAQGSRKHGRGEEKSALDGDAGEVIVERKIETSAADDENNIDFTFHDEEFITFNGENIWDSISEEERELMMCTMKKRTKGRSTEGVDSMMPFKFSDEAFKQFEEHAIAIIGVVDLSRVTSNRWLEEKPRFVKVGSNLVYPELVPLYRRVIDKQGDFTAGSPLSPIGKAWALMLLLMLMQGIRGLQICEMADDLLCTLQHFLELIGDFGFDVQFALDNLEQVARPCYALKFVKVRDDITADLTQKIEQLERDIPEDKPKIEVLKEQYRRGKESAFVKQCLAEASALKWKNAGDFLGMHQKE